MIRLPPYAGLADGDAATRTGLSVNASTSLLHRLAYVKQRLAITGAAFLPSIPEWEAKCALALHAWLDADHAGRLYARIAEMREPAPAVADVPDPALEAAMDEVLAAATTGQRLAAVYAGLRPLILPAIESYLSMSHALCDQPSRRILASIAQEEHEIERWAVDARSATPPDELADWAGHVLQGVAAAGGLLGLAPRCDAPTPRASRPYRVDILPRRDERFQGLFDTSTPADVVYLDESRPADERNAALMFKRVREMDVPEVIAGIVAERWAAERNAGERGQSWSYYTAMLRQMWDEARHAMLGQALMEAHGVDWTTLPLNVTFSWKLARFCSPVERHILLYAIEQSLMPRSHGKPYEHRVASASGDALSTLVHDFDWADEVLHVDIARRCLKPELPGGLEEARQRADDLWERIAQALAADPLPAAGPAVLDWWRRFGRRVLGRDVEPVAETHVKDWRPPGG